MNQSASRESNFTSPESIAERLLYPDEEGKTPEDLSSIILGFSPDGNDDDPQTFLFELLLTICMEMMQSILISMCEDDSDNDSDIDSNGKDGEGDEYIEFDYTVENVVEVMREIKKAFAKASILFSWTIYDANKKDTASHICERYCRTVFRFSEQDTKYFENNDDADDDKEYHFVLNNGYTPNKSSGKSKKNSNKLDKKELRDVYSIFSCGDSVIKIYFDLIVQPAGCKPIGYTVAPPISNGNP